MHILLTNDDGFDSPYLRMLCDAAVDRGHQVTVVAPHTQQSGKSHSFTTTPLLGHTREMPGARVAVSIEGTPADCSRIGFKLLCGERPDVVISGMNNGYNVGMATFLSGTCGAAREAAFNLIPAVAVSVHDRIPTETARWFSRYAILTAEKAVTASLPAMAVVNINAPAREIGQITEARMCGLTRSIYKDSYVQYDTPRGQRCFALGQWEDLDNATPGSDQDVLEHGMISCTILTPQGCDQHLYDDFPISPASVH